MGEHMIPSQMLKGILEGCILNIIANEETYGYEIVQKLRSVGFGTISEGTVYPLLLRLTKNEFVTIATKASQSGPSRKYYSLTEKGALASEHFEQNWMALIKAVDHLKREQADE